MGEQGAARDRAGDDLRLLDDRRRQHVQQILREPPDRRRVAEQLVGVEVEAPVVTVAEVEVPIDHQHFVLLQIVQRLLADLVSTAHMLSRASGLTNSARPATKVAATPPRSSQPSNGVFFERERNDRASTRTFRSGARIVMAAGVPSARLPPATRRIRAGFTESSSTMRASGISPRCSRRSSVNDTAVSRPTIPKGARSNSTCFSS